MQIGFYYNQMRCTGCYACVIACKDWNNVPAGPAAWLRISTIEKGDYPDVFVAFLAHRCYHCGQAACVSACPVGAITKRTEDGIVVVDRELCLGNAHCDMCLQVCPYEAPQFGAEPNAAMGKCNLCHERLAQGKKPVCVDACPVRALDVGPIAELRALYGDVREAEGFVYSENNAPSVAFTPKNDHKNRRVTKVSMAPPRRAQSEETNPS